MNLNLPYRPNVCIFVLNGSNNIFIGERNNCPNTWQLPQGGISEGEDLIEAAIREAYEELGVSPELLTYLMTMQAEHQYDFAVVPDYARGIYRGQKQKFVALRFNGDDSDIKLDQHDVEFMNFKWVTPSDLIDSVELKRRAGYKEPLNELVNYLKKSYTFD